MGTYNANTLVQLNKTVSAPGTATQLAQHYVPDGLMIVVTARRSNTQNMYLGASQAAAQSGVREVFTPGRSAEFRLDDTSKIWVDADNANDVLEVRIHKAV